MVLKLLTQVTEHLATQPFTELNPRGIFPLFCQIREMKVFCQNKSLVAFQYGGSRRVRMSALYWEILGILCKKMFPFFEFVLPTNWTFWYCFLFKMIVKLLDVWCNYMKLESAAHCICVLFMIMSQHYHKATRTTIDR